MDQVRIHCLYTKYAIIALKEANNDYEQDWI